MNELFPTRTIEWNFNIAKTLGDYDMIIGRDMLSDLGINLRFSDNVIEWDGQEIDFRPEGVDDDIYAVARIPDPISVEEAIYDEALQPSTYEAATTKDILPTLTHLNDQSNEKGLQEGQHVHATADV